MNELNTAWQAASQEIYQAQQAAGADPTAGAPGPDAGPTGDASGNTDSTAEDVSDVEYEEVDDKK